LRSIVKNDKNIRLAPIRELYEIWAGIDCKMYLDNIDKILEDIINNNRSLNIYD